MIYQFLDTVDESVHDRFQLWRKRNQRGVVLAFKTKMSAKVHGTRCQHFGSGLPYFPRKADLASLTLRRKVCGSQPELVRWAHRNGIALSGCRDCFRDELIGPVADRVPTAAPRSAAADISAVEGAAREVKTMTRGRNARLRKVALAQAAGICEACSTDFSKVLGGKGQRVLQVHHRKQLALRRVPSVTRSEDLAVLCANCHALVHFDSKRALPVEKLRRLLRKR